MHKSKPPIIERICWLKEHGYSAETTEAIIKEEYFNNENLNLFLPYCYA